MSESFSVISQPESAYPSPWKTVAREHLVWWCTTQYWFYPWLPGVYSDFPKKVSPVKPPKREQAFIFRATTLDTPCDL
jgi:hypothetical protein